MASFVNEAKGIHSQIHAMQIVTSLMFEEPDMGCHYFIKTY